MAETLEKEKPISTDTLGDRFPDVDVPHLGAVVQLLYHIGKEIEDIESIEATPYVKVNVGGEEWIILNKDEIEEYVEGDVENTFNEMGMDAFGVNWKDFVTNTSDFDEALAEYATNYIEGLQDRGNEEDGTSRLDQEMQEAGVASEEEFASFLANKLASEGEAMEWYAREFGPEEFIRRASVDFLALAKHLIITDGVGSIISVDGEELDLEKGYSGFRLV